MYVSTKKYGHDRGYSCAFRQWRANSHCNLIHGYALAFEFVFESETLDERNWVMDFGGLKEVKGMLDYMFDHTYLVARDDPHLSKFEELNEAKLIDLRLMDNVGCEAVSEFVFKWVNDWLDRKYDAISLRSVQVWEHEGNSARYEK